VLDLFQALRLPELPFRLAFNHRAGSLMLQSRLKIKDLTL
jgi:hypothetical protein